MKIFNYNWLPQDLLEWKIAHLKKRFLLSYHINCLSGKLVISGNKYDTSQGINRTGMLKIFLQISLIMLVGLLSSLSAQPEEIDDQYLNYGIRTIKDSYHFWENLMLQEPAWWQSAAAVNLAENVLIYQRECGGWPKNINMLKPLRDAEKKDLATYPNEPLATIDNDATWSQMRFLARLISYQPEQRYILSFLKGLDYLLDAQYENGGWPQYYPKRKGYYTHITYNDKAMIGVLTLLKDIVDNHPDFEFVDEKRRKKAESAVKKGIDCILKTQVKVKGELTAWCAQHDEKTLQPVGARNYELPSLASKESSEILVFLMSVENPSNNIITAVQAAVSWLEQVKLENIILVKVKDERSSTGFDRRIKKQKGAKPLWARFYDIETMEPIFSDRDGKVYQNLADISYERRNDYGWIGDWPRDIMYNKYKNWQRKYLPEDRN